MDKRFRINLILTGALGISFLAWLLLNHAGPHLRKAVSDLVQTAIPLVAACWTFLPVTSRKTPGTPRRNRLWGADLVGAYFILYALGTAFYTYCEIILHQEAPFPSIADACYIPSYLCLMAGILLLPSERTSGVGRGRVLLDNLMILVAIIAFSWYYILGPTLFQSAETWLGKLLGAAYPIADLAIFACLITLSLRSPLTGKGYIRQFLAIGLICTLVADIIYGYLNLHNAYFSGHVIDVLWPEGQLLMACGICSLRRVHARSEGKETKVTPALPPPVWHIVLPYALIPLVACLVAYTRTVSTDDKLEPGLYLISLALVGLILCRQLFALLENRRLYAEVKQKNALLEAKTREAIAYAKLQERANAELQAIQKELQASHDELAVANGKLEQLATTDGMTGLANHRTFQERLRAELARCDRAGVPLSLLLMDVDRFKEYNDRFGHPAGDEALRIVARLLKANVRVNDLPARYGGEEFTVLLPETSLEESLLIAERIRASVEEAMFPGKQLTLSIGATSTEITRDDAEALVDSADRALYTAKRGGRNRVFAAAETKQAA